MSKTWAMGLLFGYGLVSGAMLHGPILRFMERIALGIETMVHPPSVKHAPSPASYPPPVGGQAGGGIPGPYVPPPYYYSGFAGKPY